MPTQSVDAECARNEAYDADSSAAAGTSVTAYLERA